MHKHIDQIGLNDMIHIDIAYRSTSLVTRHWSNMDLSSKLQHPCNYIVTL